MINGLRLSHIRKKYPEVVVLFTQIFPSMEINNLSWAMSLWIVISRRGSVNIVHYALNKNSQVCTSVVAAELFAFVDCFDVGYELISTLKNVYHKKLTYHCTRTVRHCIACVSHCLKPRSGEYRFISH